MLHSKARYASGWVPGGKMGILQRYHCFQCIQDTTREGGLVKCCSNGDCWARFERKLNIRTACGLTHTLCAHQARRCCSTRACRDSYPHIVGTHQQTAAILRRVSVTPLPTRTSGTPQLDCKPNHQSQPGRQETCSCMSQRQGQMCTLHIFSCPFCANTVQDL